MEEYENLKRLPDPRQVALERFQQQQRLNAQIALQNAAAAAQLRPNLHPNNARNAQFEQMIQRWQMSGLLNAIATPFRPTGFSSCYDLIRHLLFLSFSPYSTKTEYIQ